MGNGTLADGRYLLTACNDQTVNVRRIATGQLLLSFFEAGNDWIAWTPQGYYAASLAGEHLMGWHINDGPERMANYYSAAQFHNSLYRPDVIRRVLDSGDIYQALEVADRQRDIHSRQLVVTDVLPPRVALFPPRGRNWRQTIRPWKSTPLPNRSIRIR